MSSIPGVVYRRECVAPWTMCFVSDYIEVITGMPSDDFASDCGRSFASIVHPDDADHVAAKIAEDFCRDAPFPDRVSHRQR